VDKKCTVCLSPTELIFERIVLNRYKVSYFYCSNCGLLQTEKPYWLAEAYENAIADSDTGLVYRNISTAWKIANILFFLLEKDGKYLDMAGGYGMLTRLMRDIGFDFYWSDVYCENLLAKGFELSTTKPPFNAIAAFEVLEHIYDPLEFIKESLDRSQTSTIVLSTELFSGMPPDPAVWEYYAFEEGQHISFYQIKTLEFIADRLSLRLYSHGNFHILTDRSMPSKLVWGLLTGKFSMAIGLCVKLLMKSKSKTLTDRHAILQGRSNLDIPQK
jgi:Methyltransferase domain